ncbi:uncharacterized protein FIESC28_03091 [Fusarium coffeatum]|uniref:Uncharacterized protein n=1 Tax=Fusarium coffeatum TaxID=231269 RepID=A0A366S507_9HYPO|nr:uncharacterized protein FIESC28_03091 [Fusarium coffeatum]RBR24092.1 hypothetical protein FIESC28_03091 [Fusarium coffeatum]
MTSPSSRKTVPVTTVYLHGGKPSGGGRGGGKSVIVEVEVSLQHQKPQEEEELRKYTITLVSFYLRLHRREDLHRPQSAFASIYHRLKSQGHRQFAASIRDEIFRELEGRSTFRESSNIQLSDDISELLQEAENDEGFLFSVISFGHESVEPKEDDRLRSLGQLEKIEIHDYSIDLDLKLTAASGIACAQRSRALDPREGRSFLEVCYLICDRFGRLSSRVRWPAASPAPLLTNLNNQLYQLYQLDQFTKRLFVAGQTINNQQMMNQQDSFQLYQVTDLLSQQMDQITRFLPAAVGQVAPPSTPEGPP